MLSMVTMLSQLAGHEEAVRVVRVAAERPAGLEAVAGVEGPGGSEDGLRASLQAEATVGAAAGLVHDRLEDAAADAFAQVRRHGAHGFDLPVRMLERLQRAAAKELPSFPGGPHRDAGLAQRVERQGMDALRRRVEEHVSQVLAQQLRDLGAGQIVEPDLHALRSASITNALSGHTRTPLILSTERRIENRSSGGNSSLADILFSFLQFRKALDLVEVRQSTAID